MTIFVSFVTLVTVVSLVTGCNRCNKMKDKSLMFMILALGCVWLVLDEFYGKNYISKFITALIPKAEA